MFARAILARAPRVLVQTPKLARGMGGGGHGHAAPKYEGFEAMVRKFLPENYQVRYLMRCGVVGGGKGSEAESRL